MLYALAYNTTPLYTMQRRRSSDVYLAVSPSSAVDQYFHVREQQFAEVNPLRNRNFDQDQIPRILLDGRSSVMSAQNRDALIQTLTLAADLQLMTSSAIRSSSAALEARCDELYSIISNMPEGSWMDFDVLHLLV